MNRTQIINEAKKLVTEERNQTHGEPKENFTNIAAYWTIYLRAAGLLVEDTKIRPEDVAMLNVLQKVARIASSSNNPDHYVDIAGYAACGGECVDDEIPF